MSWYEANQAHLMSEIAGVRAALERCAAGADPPEEEITRAASTMSVEEIDPPPAIEQLSHAFGLSPFERAILLMCAGVELDTSFARFRLSVAPWPRSANRIGAHYRRQRRCAAGA